MDGIPMNGLVVLRTYLRFLSQSDFDPEEKR